MKHFLRYWLFVRGIHRSPANSPHKGHWRGALKFSLICARKSSWANHRVAGDLRRHRAHYDVTVMWCTDWSGGLFFCVLTRVLFWCSFPELRRNEGCPNWNNTQVSAYTICHSSTYILLFRTRHYQHINVDRKEEHHTSTLCLTCFVYMKVMMSQSFVHCFIGLGNYNAGMEKVNLIG